MSDDIWNNILELQSEKKILFLLCQYFFKRYINTCSVVTLVIHVIRFWLIWTSVASIKRVPYNPFFSMDSRRLCYNEVTVYLSMSLFCFQLYICEMILEQEGVHGYCGLDELALDLLPLDTDILSMETPSFFRSFYLVWVWLFFFFIVWNVACYYSIILYHTQIWSFFVYTKCKRP